MERWGACEISHGELQDALVALLDHETIDVVVAALPEEHRAELLECFDRLDAEHATGEGRLSIRGGTFFTRERHGWKFTDEEWDRIEREERERDARERAHFRNVTLPAILDWRARRAR